MGVREQRERVRRAAAELTCEATSVIEPDGGTPVAQWTCMSMQRDDP